MTTKIGIITYHAAYNFGSQLQAYATQRTVDALGYESEIINYRLPNQIHYYGDQLSFRFGWKEAVKRSLWLTERKARKLRAERFENFIQTRFRLGEGTYHTFDELRNAGLNYQTLIVGSDQVWNEHCVAEFMTEPPESIRGYFLDFETDLSVKRIAFSSSIGGMTEEEIGKYLPLLERFHAISVREKETAELLSRLLKRDVVNTLDPTLMLDRAAWEKELLTGTPEEPSKGYILVYSLLKNPVKALKLQKSVLDFARGKRVFFINPFISVHIPGIQMRNDCGPIEFLNLLRNADCMITDSFHGTAFSVNFGIPFYSINTGKDKRKTQLLSRVDLKSQLITSLEGLSEKSKPEIDFSTAHSNLIDLRNISLDFLKTSLSA